MAAQNDSKKSKRRLPPWLRRRIPAGAKISEVSGLLDELKLTTVCDGAHCPNRGQCFASGTATFMILGERCTRNCRFCAVEPVERLEVPRADEPEAVAEAVSRMGLKYVVITSVTRDDLPDGGAEHFARTIKAVREKCEQGSKGCKKVRIEVLTPDFKGDRTAIGTVLAAGPDVFNHNVETVERMYESIRPQADYRQSLDVLAASKQIAPEIITKSGLMVGVGEKDEELLKVFADLRDVNCEVLTIGQYLAPSEKHHPIDRFVEPEIFDSWRETALSMGFKAVASGPYVRSSFMAEDVFNDAGNSGSSDCCC